MLQLFRAVMVSTVLAIMPLFSVYAQLNEGGEPLSFQLEKSFNLSQIPVERMQSVDMEALRAEDRLNDYKPATPFRFGKNLEVNINPHNSGVWDEVKEGYRIWRVGIQSPGARSINLLFDDYKLPEGAKLYIYNKDRSDLIGAFTHRNNQDDGFFATTLVAGDDIVIEYFDHPDVEFEGSLNLARVTHGYRAYGEKSSDFGSSGSCNLNVACEESEGWEEEISSAGRMVVNGNSWCSGQLINNTNNDGTPYFLSANHCYTNPGQVVFWFNYESETCSNPSSPPSHDALSGAVDVSRNSASDFWLMELNDEIPSEYDLFFSGWNRTMDEEIDGYIFAVHHPSGDIKKFSYLFDGVTTSSYLGDSGSGSTHWRVGTWADGTTTEPGSSGSALFDGNGLIIGQLHGGYAACGNTLEDWYGKLGVSWEGGGSPNSRLKDWLDPGNTGVVEMPGYNPNIGVVDIDAQVTGIPEPTGVYSPEDEFTPTVRIRNAGIETLTEALVSYEIEGVGGESFEWTGELETAQIENVTFESMSLPEGDYEITGTIFVEGDENPDNDTRSGTFRVVDCTQPPQLPFVEDFSDSSSIPECWEVVDHIGNGQVWQVGNIGNRGIDGADGNYAYLDSDAYGIGNSQDSDLITPALDLSNFENVELSFTHYFRDYTSSTATLYFSIDDGESWTMLEQWQNDTPNPEYFSEAVPEADGQEAVKFKWNFEGEWDWYWSVDDIVVDGDFVEPEPAIVQLVHNAADPLLASVDVYLNGELAAEEVAFRSALSGLEFPASTEVTIGIAAAGSETMVMEFTETFDSQEHYLIVVRGLTEPESFAPNPDGHNTGADVEIYNEMFEWPQDEGESETLVYFYHGVTDAPAVDIAITGGDVLEAELGYSMMSEVFHVFMSDSHELEIRDTLTGEALFAFDFDLSMYEDQLIGVYASGFLDPDENQFGPALGLFAVLENGEVFELNQVTNIGDQPEDIPERFELAQNYPNPFNPNTSIQYALPEQTHVRLDVYNLMGQRVATLVDGTESPGRYNVSFDASRLSSGMYIYRLQAGSYTETRKMMLVK